MDGKNILATNKRYKTKNINGVNAVHLGDLGLQYGIIDPQNSVPYIDVNNVQRVLDLDKAMGQYGTRYKITSAMGGQHKGGPRSHGSGQKLDIAPIEGTTFNPQIMSYLNKNYVGNGAVGQETDHIDISIGRRNGMDQQPIMRPGPELLNPTNQLTGAYQGGLLSNAQIYDLIQKQQNALARQYDIAAARNSAQENINKATAEVVPQINEQMYQNIDDPIVFQHAQQHADDAQNKARDIAQRDLALAQLEYYRQRNPEEMANMYDERVQRFLDTMNAQNPYNQTKGKVQGYQIDPKEYAKALARDNALSSYMRGAAMMNANSNPRLAAMQMEAARQGQNTAEQYLKQAQMNYIGQVANQLGVPPEVIQKEMEHNMKMAEALAPGASSAYKEAAVLQPNQNLRTYMTEVPKVAEDVYKDTILDEQERMNELLQRNKMYKELNLPAAQAQQQSLKDITEMQGKYPQQTLEKYKTQSGNTSKADQAIVQGTTSMTGNYMKNVADTNKNINTQVERAYEEQGKDMRKAIDVAQKAVKAEEKKKDTTTEDLLKDAQKKNTYVKGIASQLIDPRTGFLPDDPGVLYNALQNDGILTQDEIDKYIKRYYPNIK